MLPHFAASVSYASSGVVEAELMHVGSINPARAPPGGIIRDMSGHRAHSLWRARGVRAPPARDPEAPAGTAVVRVRAFGLNHAEAYFLAGAWVEVAKVSGIECVGESADPDSTGLAACQRVSPLLGMGRTIDGSYAAYVQVPAHHVVAIDSALPWTELAALPESYATAWVLLRGATSALGQAAINLARNLDVR